MMFYSPDFCQTWLLRRDFLRPSSDGNAKEWTSLSKVPVNS